MKILQKFIEEKKDYFEANFLDGDKMSDCGKCTMVIDEDFIKFLDDSFEGIANLAIDECLGILDKTPKGHTPDGKQHWIAIEDYAKSKSNIKKLKGR